MTASEPGTRKELAAFLGLTFGVSAVFWWLIATAGGLDKGPGYLGALMWTPGVCAFATQLVFHRTLRGLGWRLPAARWAVLAYLIPLAYATAAYGAVWLARLGGVDFSRFKGNPLSFLVLVFLQSLLFATGEELGWRGFLVPALARRMSLGRTAAVSGAIWAVWHVPLIAFADYNAGTPLAYALLCFSVSVISISLPLAWLRLRSGSVWPAAILHASHNLFIQGFFDVVTVETGKTRWLTTEFGAALALATAATAWLFWRVRGAVGE